MKIIHTYKINKRAMNSQVTNYESKDNTMNIEKLSKLNDNSNEYVKVYSKSSKLKYRGVYEKLQMIQSTNPKFKLIVEILISQQETIKNLEERIKYIEKEKVE